MSRTIGIISSLIILLIAVSGVQSACSASASLSRRQVGVQQQILYDITVVNTGTCDITAVQVRISISGDGAITQSFNLATTATTNTFSVTNFGGAIRTSTSYTGAGFIVTYTSSITVTVDVDGVTCASSCPTSVPTAPTSAPTTPTSAPSPTNPPAGGSLPSQALLNSLTLAATEVQRENLLNASDFVFDFANSHTGLSIGTGGKTVAATRANFPALIGHGVAMTIGYIAPCSINLPHTHPRATEINFITQGEFLAGFFSENGAHFIGNTVKGGMATVFPQGAIHFEMNTQCTSAIFVAAFNNEDPGVQTVGSTFFGLPAEIVSTSLNISNIKTVEDLAAHLPVNPAIALGECRARCGL